MSKTTSRRATHGIGAVVVLALALGAIAAPSAADRRAEPPRDRHADGHSYDLRPADAAELAAALGMKVSPQAGARTALQSARTVSQSPSTGPDFEMPFLCGTSWSGSTRSGHSPSYYSIDFNAPNDYRKPVLASAPGTVVLVRSLTYSYGKYVVIDHGSGFTTLYAHLDSLSATVGQRVDQGDLVGYLGTTGGSTGPHLHFEQRKDGAYFNPWFTRTPWRFGATATSTNCGDRPAVGDWDDDGVDEVGVWRARPLKSKFVVRDADRRRIIRWGAPGHTPVAGDYDGDGRAQAGTKALGTPVRVLRSANGAVARVSVGGAVDVPLSGDWDADGRDELGWYSWATRSFSLRMSNGAVQTVPWGASGRTPVVGDWNGDGIDDVGSFDPATGVWTLRVPTGTTFTTQSIKYGVAGDLPAAGDWNGDGVDELGIWRPSNAQFHQRVGSGSTARSAVLTLGQRRG